MNNIDDTNNNNNNNNIVIKKTRGRKKMYTEEEIKERKRKQGREYRARNLEARREACKKCNSKKVSCPGCGAVFNINNMKKHLLTKKHKQAMEHIQTMKRNTE